MIINNFNQIEKLLDFRPGKNNQQVCYIIQLIKRRKDKGNEGMDNGSRIIKTMLVCNLDQFHTRKEEIIRECNFHNCRAYISVHPKSQASIAKLYSKTILDMLLDGETEFHFNRLLESCVGKTGACPADIDNSGITESRTRWIVDVDTKDPLDVLEIGNTVLDIVHKYNPDVKPIIEEIPTLHGYHIITLPFNLQEFNKKYPGVDVHKNNETLLYFNALEEV